MVKFDRSIPPGEEGIVRLQINTHHYKGAISKSAMVYTNDPAKPRALLKLRAFVKPRIEVSPRKVYLHGGEAGDSATVEISTNMDKPLKLQPAEFVLGGKVTYRLEEVEKGRRFRVHFVDVQGPPAYYKGYLKLKTNYPEKSEITIWLRGRFVNKN